ncbi:MAG: hypothetical protein AB1705_14590 [Verrucomicrobiota bacterium]
MIAPRQPPTFQSGIAQTSGESLYPELWKGLVIAQCPSLGRQSGLRNIPDRRWNGTYNGSLGTNTWQGNFLEFDGVGDYVSTPFDLSSRFTTDGATLLMRLKLRNHLPTDALKTSLCWAYPLIADTHYPYTDNLIYCSIFRSTRYDSITTPSWLARANWHWFGVSTRNGASNYKLWATAGARGYGAANNFYSNTGASSISLGTQIHLGKGRPDGGVYLDGWVSDFFIWNRCLSQQDINAVCSGASPFSRARRFYSLGKVPAVSADITSTPIARIDKPTISLVFLAEITCGLWAREWVLTSGRTITYEVATSLDVTEVKCNGVALTERASVGLVDSNPGSWIQQSGFLYVSAPTGTPFDKTIIATVAFRFATRQKIFNNQDYSPRLISAPSLQLRIEEDFGGVGQIGGGTLVLANNDGFFDNKEDLLWDYGRVTVKVGFDQRGSDQAYADYVTIGTWLAEDWDFRYDKFSLKLREVASKLKKKVPIEVFTRGDYPVIKDEFLGKPIPRAYGVCYGVKPILIDPGLKKFKVAGHAIRSLDAVRIKINDVWTTSSFATTDVANAEFTLGADYEDGRDVSIDLQGRKNADGTLMVNAADIVEDLLAYIGETDLATASFTTAFNRLDIGPNNQNGRTTSRRVSLYLDTLQDATKVFGSINELVGSYLFCDSNGQYHYGVFGPSAGEALTHFSERDFFSFEPSVDNKDRFTEVAAKYAERKQDDWAALETLEKAAFQYIHNEPAARLKEVTLGFSEERDAEYWCQRFLEMHGPAWRTWRIKLPWRAIRKLPGDQIRVTDARRGFDEVLEILSINLNLDGKVDIICGNQRGFAARGGFVVNASDTLPARFASLAGYGSGSLTWNANWHDDIKRWVRQNVAYVTDSNGFADAADPESFLASKVI